MKQLIGHIILIALLVLLVLSIGLSYHRAVQNWASRSHPAIEIKLTPGNKNYVTRSEIRHIVAGIPRNDTMQMHRYLQLLENKIENHPMVEKAEVWIDPKGILHTEIRQITPIAVINTNGKTAYMDRRGQVLPVSQVQNKSIPVVTGIIGTAEEKKLFPLLNYVYHQPHLHHRLRRMEYDGNNLRLYMRTLAAPVVFGDTVDYRWKFYKLIQFEKYLTGRRAANPYTEINLMFDNQIVCTKNN